MTRLIKLVLTALVKHGTIRYTMDFIERIFGISPDGGSGLLELVLPLGILLLCIAIPQIRKHRMTFQIASMEKQVTENA